MTKILIFIIVFVLLCLLYSCKRDDCYKEILKLAPTYVELRTTYKILRPKAIEYRKKGKIDDDTWNMLITLDKKLRIIDNNATNVYNKAINDSSKLSKEDIELILGITQQLVTTINRLVPQLLL